MTTFRSSSEVLRLQAESLHQLMRKCGYKTQGEWVKALRCVTIQQMSGFMNARVRITKTLADHLDNQHPEHRLNGLSLVQLLDAHREQQKLENVKPDESLADAYAIEKKTYDIFLSAPMASLSDKDYVESRNEVMKIKRELRNLGMASYYAGEQLKNISQFDPESLASVQNLEAQLKSKYFVLISPGAVNRASSIYFEAGIAVALGQPSVYFVDKRASLPFVMRAADQMAGVDPRVGRVQIIEGCSSCEKARNHIKLNGSRIFGLKK